jgi:hypothetical protein
MKQVFLIHAHKDLDQLNALVGQLCDEDFLIYVNLDRKSTIDPARLHPGARLVDKRIDVRWGGFSQVEATLNSLRQILREVARFDKVVFLSAQDFPLLPNDRLKQELALVEGRELIDTMPIGPDGWRVAFRYQYFYREGGSKPERIACALANRLLRLCKTTRRPPRAMRPYGGSSWWALSRPCLQHLLERVGREWASVRFFRTVLCPDEMFFQTMVMSSRFRERVLSENFRYIQWPEQGARNPKVLDEADFDRIRASGAHFCRKLDSKLSAALLPRLVQLRESRAGWHAHALTQREPRAQRGV